MSLDTVLDPGARRAVLPRVPLLLLLLLLLLTAVVPQEVLRRGEVVSLLPTDGVLALLLGWAALDLPWRRLDRRTCWVLAGLVVFLLVVLAQLTRSLAEGRSLSGSGGEARVLLGFGSLLAALPLLADPVRRSATGRGLVGLGMALGAWGVVQPVLGLVFDAPLETVRSTSASFQSSGRTVGMWAFPVAALCAFAAVALRVATTSRGRLALVLVALSNTAAVLLTLQRTFIAVLLLGFVVLLCSLPAGSRRRLLVQAGGSLLALLLALSVLQPGRLAEMRAQFAVLGDRERDPSVQYRSAESRLVLRHISGSPWTGEGPGAAMRIGRPGTSRAVVDRRYAENGYLWLVWKMGLPAAVLLCAVLLAAATAPGRRRLPDPAGRALAAGSRASLVALAVATGFFGGFAQLAISSVVGVLAAACLAPSSDVLPEPAVASHGGTRAD